MILRNVGGLIGDVIPPNLTDRLYIIIEYIGRIRLGDFRGALLGHAHIRRSRLCSMKICESNRNCIVFLSKMTDQMEARKRKLINIRPIDFILDDDDDVGGDNCNDVAHIEQDIF